MVAVSWNVVVANGGQPPGGDMIGHAAAAEWLRTLPWWDWRGWSDWFYGGQAIGVNYPPLGHAWMRFTHPVHGQMAAVALGLLVLLPWGALRLARAVGYSPRVQRAAVAAVCVLTAAAGEMHWVLSGFHSERTFFGSWPAMMSTVVGLHVAAWAARCRRPVASGALAGVAVLLNATVIPGVAVVCVALLATSGATTRQACRWMATAGAAAVAVSAWWLVPFIAGWERLVRWEMPLHGAWDAGGTWQAGVLAVVGVLAAWAARTQGGPARRLAIAALSALVATVTADLLGYLRSERWLELPILIAVVAAIGLFASRSRQEAVRPARPAWIILCAAFLIVFLVVTLRLEVLPLMVWLLLWPRRTWVWGGSLAWAAVLLSAPLLTYVLDPAPSEPLPTEPLEAAALFSDHAIEGLVYTDPIYATAIGDLRSCQWGQPWLTTAATSGRIRPLFGIYRETSSAAEFLGAEVSLRTNSFAESDRARPHWSRAWHEAGSPTLDTPTRATALGAQWYAECDEDGNVSVTELPGETVVGAKVTAHMDEQVWHRAAVEWWISASSEFSDVPVLSSRHDDVQSYPRAQAAQGVSLRTGQDSLTVRANGAGWAWLRVPWDPYWKAVNGTPVHKGGPGHLIVWANQGTTELRWSVPRLVDGAAAAVTGIALLTALTLSIVNRRLGWYSDPGRRSPTSNAINLFADTVDGWAQAGAKRVSRAIVRSHRGEDCD